MQVICFEDISFPALCRQTTGHRIFGSVKVLPLLLLINFFKSPCLLSQPSLACIHPTQLVTTEKLYPVSAITQVDTVAPSKRKIELIAGVHATAYAGTLALLSAAWYKQYPRTAFNTFNDSGEWLQLDKAGHAWTAFNIAHYSSQLWQSTGMNSRTAVWLGGFSSLAYQSIIEFLDGHSAQWGWSWADMGANTVGASLYTAQALAWQQQKLALKFSSFPYAHPAALRQRADVLFGKTFPERLLKDYNAQTYWLSANLKSLGVHRLPVWLNLALGYGGNGLYGGFKNIAYDKNGTLVFNRPDVARVRQWFLAPDIDWTKIYSRKKSVRVLLNLLNMVKVPAPALELRAGRLRTRWLAF